MTEWFGGAWGKDKLRSARLPLPFRRIAEGLAHAHSLLAVMHERLYANSESGLNKCPARENELTQAPGHSNAALGRFVTWSLRRAQPLTPSRPHFFERPRFFSRGV